MEQDLDHYFWKGDLVVLRQASETDIPKKLAEYYDSESRSFLQDGVSDLPPVPHEMYAEDYPGEINADDRDLTKRIGFAIDNFDGDYVGWIVMHSREPRHGRFAVGGISIFREYRGKGYAADALRIILRYGFHELRMQKCNSQCRADNEASRKLHEGVGFVQEGVRRRNVYTNNQYYDEILYGLLKEEFEEFERSRRQSSK